MIAVLPRQVLSMCLGIPGKIIEIYQEHDLQMGRVDFGGVIKRVCLEHVSEPIVGDYVLVHVGFAISRIDEAEAQQVFAFLEAMNELDEIRAESDPPSEFRHPPLAEGFDTDNTRRDS